MGITIFKGTDDYVTFAPGEVIFTEGENGDYMFVIIDGEVDVSSAGKHIHTVGAGSAVGEMALIDSSPRSATVTATVETKAVKVDRKRFEFLVQHTPFFAVQVMKILVDRLREATKMGVQY